MKQEFYNSAAIFDVEGGIGELQVAIATRIANPKRRKVLCDLAVRQLASLEQLVSEMDHEEVERLHLDLEPLHGANGNGERSE